MRKTLYLHIGMGKTGTTALQNFFAAHERVMAARGVVYPRRCQIAHAHHLASPHHPPFLDNSGWKFERPEDWAPALAQGAAPAYLMSSELIAWAAPEKVGPYCAAIMAHLDLRIVLYLRRQDNIIMAGYNQQLKAGTQKRPIHAVIDKQLDRFDYLARIAPWEAEVGTANIIVRPYERQQFHEGDLRKDFLHNVLGIADMSGFDFAPAGNSNPRYARAAMEYKRFVNCVFQNVDDSNAFNPLLLRYSADASAAATDVFVEHDTLSKADRRAVLDRFAADNAHIARTYMGREGGVLFTDDRIADDVEIPPVSEEAFADITALIRAQEPRLYKRLVARLREIDDEEAFIVKQARNFLSRSLQEAPAAD